MLGTVLLGAALLFGVYGVIVHAAQGEPRYVRDSTYVEECGACHLAYPPGLLPEQSWNGVMAGLEDHFGENAELDSETATYLRAYLIQYALRPGQPSRISKFLRNMPEKPPLRITELPGFVSAHAEVPEQLEIKELEEGFLSPCADCHRTAASNIFDKELLHPGYGPSIWGGKPE